MTSAIPTAPCCDNPYSVPRKKRNSAGNYYVVTQCRSCGAWGSRGSHAVSHKELHAKGITDISALTDFDEAAFERVRHDGLEIENEEDEEGDAA